MLKLIGLSVVTPLALTWVLHIVSNFVMTTLLISQVTKIRTYGFMFSQHIEIRSILTFKHEFTVYIVSFQKGGLTGPQLLEGGCWERGVDIFQGVAIFTIKIIWNI